MREEAHVTYTASHLFPGVYTTTTTLAVTSGTKRPVTERVTVGSILTMKPPFFHHARKALSLAVRACVDKLADKEPVRSNLFADGQQPCPVPDAEFSLVLLRTHTLGREVPQHWFCDVSVMFPAAAHAYSIVTMSLHRFMTDNFIAIDLQHCARYSFSRFDIVNRCHPFLGCQCSCP